MNISDISYHLISSGQPPRSQRNDGLQVMVFICWHRWLDFSSSKINWKIRGLVGLDLEPKYTDYEDKCLKNETVKEDRLIFNKKKMCFSIQCLFWGLCSISASSYITLLIRLRFYLLFKFQIRILYQSWITKSRIYHCHIFPCVCFNWNWFPVLIYFVACALDKSIWYSSMLSWHILADDPNI